MLPGNKWKQYHAEMELGEELVHLMYKVACSLNVVSMWNGANSWPMDYFMVEDNYYYYLLFFNEV